MTEHGYIFTSREHGSFSPEGKVSAPIDVDAHNRAVEARELAHWAAQPTHHVGYYSITARPLRADRSACRVNPCTCHDDSAWTYTDWSTRPYANGCSCGCQWQVNTMARALGRVNGRPVTVRTWLGTVIGHGLVTSAHTNNLGARIVRVRVLGTNGATYWGAASYDADIIRLHKVRS